MSIDVLYAALGLALLGALVALLWRSGSRIARFPCPSWLAWMVEADNPFAWATGARALIAAAGLRPGMQVLDFGCGPGRVAVPAAQAVAPVGQVWAVDVQAAMLRRAEAKASTANVTNIRFLQAASGAGALGLQQFDRAFLVTVLGEIPDRRTALLEIFNSRKPGGILTIAEIALDPHYQTRRSVADLAVSVGFHAGLYQGGWYGYSLNLEKPTQSRA